MDDSDGAAAEGSARAPCPITLHVPTSSLSWGPDIVSDEASSSSSSTARPGGAGGGAAAAAAAMDRDGAGSSSGSNSRRRPHPGGLDTLPEASHVNALASATGPSPMGLGSSDVDGIVGAALASLPPPSRSLAVARSSGYSSIAIELTNERWRHRWMRLCLAPSSLAQSSSSSSSSSSSAPDTTPKPINAWKRGDPGAMGGSWEVVAQASGAGGLGVPYEGDTGLPRSSSRSRMSATTTAAAGATTSTETIDEATAREAEEWRRMPSFRRGEVNITSLDESDGVLAVASPWLELDSADEGIRLDSEIALRQEVAYAAHIGLAHVVLPPPSSEPASRRFLVDYARAIAGLLTRRGTESAPAGAYMRLSIRLPVSSPYRAAQMAARLSSSSASASVSASAPVPPAQMRAADDDDWAWQAWEVVRSVARYHARLGVVLDVSAPLAPAFALQRWQAEPVRAVWLPATSFLANAKGYPVLSKAAQSLLRTLLAKNDGLNLVVAGTQHRPPHHTRGGQAAYQQYLRHVERTMPPPTSVQVRARGYHDFLQAPLQPLLDNLEAQTYAVFEADPAKYQLYEQAVFQALVSLPRGGATTSSGIVAVWVVGAGRGPLVDRCLAAAQRARRTIRIVAVEKNVHACVGLRDRAETEWGADVVEVRMGDMRTLPAPQHERERADIVVSELLGSFGDNELSPECLDGAMRFLKADGISIPQAYSCYLTPIATPKLHAQIMTGSPLSMSSAVSSADAGRELRAAETPYVVLLDAYTSLAAPPLSQQQQHQQQQTPPREAVQLCWAFEHTQDERRAKHVLAQGGLPLTNGHNARSCNLTFDVAHEGTCHGLAGYFEAQLFDDVFVSIHPDAGRASQDMLSWFPIFFPFKDPLYCPAGAEMDVSMWRLTSGHRVWYEWCAEVFLSLPSSGPAAGLVGSNAGAGDATGATAATAGQRAASGASDATSSSMGRGPSNDGVGAFSNAPNTPRLPMSQLPGSAAAAVDEPGSSNHAGGVGLGLPSVGVGAGAGAGAGIEMGRRGSNSSQVGAVNSSNAARSRRIKVGMTPLMNPGGRSSFVSM